ncbi:unnamed protein product [Dovyalis caffra]|uniref:Peptidase A1 domain-containing protein n=1 Tax=Dovyalis caffra TaxID=77055 RepID=A0AAV1SMD9_9ROSI|nr:unnamed protein product [Dovyalis caffra]
MATLVSSNSPLARVLYSFLLFCLLSSVKKDNAVEGTKAYFHTLKINSRPLLDVCKESSKGTSVLNKGSASLKVVHKYGPCYRHKRSIPPPSFIEILRRDKLRVDSIIQSRRSMNWARNVEHMKSGIPFRGLSKDTISDYVVNIGLGTPTKEVPLIFDTGSGLIWTQCKPCKPCYGNAPVFDPTKSTSFKGIPCSSKQCLRIEEAVCSSNSKCSYIVGYVDNTTSTGIYATETITFNQSNYDFRNILIGCSNQISGDLDQDNSGILGLNRQPISFPSQTADKFNELFSYCIPSTPGSTGYLTFGGEVSTDVKFSPVSNRAASSDYDIEMTGISVGGRKLLIDVSVFKIRCAIDSGTVFTRLPPKAYKALRSMFREMMKSYPLVDIDETLDTCYNFRNYKTVTIPAVSVFFKGGVEVDINVSGIMFGDVESKVYCLAFAALDEEYAIFGNVQQQTYTLVFDGARERIGFAPGGCD